MENKILPEHKNRWLITAAVCMVTMGQGVLLYGVSAFLTIMVDELGLTGAQQGTFTGIQNLVTMVFTLLGTVIAIRIGTKKYFGFGGLLIMAAAVCFYLGTYPSLIMARIFMGIANGMTFTMVASIFNQIFGSNKKAATLATGIYGAGTYLGRYLALAISFPIYSIVGSWQMTFIILASVATVGSLIWFVVYPSDEEYQGRNKSAGALSETLNAWKVGWKNSTVRKFALYFSLSAFTGVVFNTFSVALIVYVYGFEAKVAAGTVAYSGLAGLAGSLIGSYIASRSRVKNVIIPAQFVSGFCIILMVMLKNPTIGVLTLICSIQGFCNGAQSCNNISLMYKQTNMKMQEILGGVSLVMFLQKFCSYFTAQVFGAVYPKIGMDKAMLIWAVPVIISGIVVCTINEPKMSELEKRA